MNWYKVILSVLGVVAIILVLLQGGRTNGFSMTNNELSLFKNKKSEGLEKRLEISTGIIVAGIMLITMLAF